MELISTQVDIVDTALVPIPLPNVLDFPGGIEIYAASIGGAIRRVEADHTAGIVLGTRTS